MAKFKVPYHCPNRFDLERYCMNGQVPNPSAFRRLADGFNHVTTVQKKQVAAFVTDWDSAPSGSTSNRIAWPCAFRTSRGTGGLIVALGVVKSDTVGATEPFVRLRVFALTDGTESTVISEKDVYFNQRASAASIIPDDVNHQIAVLGGLSPNTEYKLKFSAQDGARIVYASAWEARSTGVLTIVGDQPADNMLVDDGDDDVCNPGGFSSEADILSSHISKLVTTHNNLLKHSRTHLIQYSATPYEQVSGSGIAISGSTSYSDVVNRTFNIDTTYLTTYRRAGTATAVPIRLAICGVRTSGSGTLSVGLYDVNAAAIVAEITGVVASSPTTNGWYVTSAYLPDQDGVYQIHAKQSNGTTTHVLYGVSAWPYIA